MKISIAVMDRNNVSKEITVEADKDRAVSIDITESGKIELFSGGIDEKTTGVLPAAE